MSFYLIFIFLRSEWIHNIIFLLKMNLNTYLLVYRLREDVFNHKSNVKYMYEI